MEKQTSAHEVEAAKGEPIYDADRQVDYDRAGAIEAERVEHDMTVLQAVKAYPAASWWAFVMSCTIVSSLLVHDMQMMTISLTLRCDRSWSRIVCS
jgi:SP family general alpha glucoside:H+ symporter-like MFS transporter